MEPRSVLQFVFYTILRLLQMPEERPFLCPLTPGGLFLKLYRLLAGHGGIPNADGLVPVGRCQPSAVGVENDAGVERRIAIALRRTAQGQHFHAAFDIPHLDEISIDPDQPFAIRAEGQVSQLSWRRQSPHGLPIPLGWRFPRATIPNKNFRVIDRRGDNTAAIGMKSDS